MNSAVEAVSADAFLTPGDVMDGETVKMTQMNKAVVSVAQTLWAHERVCVCEHMCTCVCM